jgi:hypothetical protein
LSADQSLIHEHAIADLPAQVEGRGSGHLQESPVLSHTVVEGAHGREVARIIAAAMGAVDDVMHLDLVVRSAVSQNDIL